MVELSNQSAELLARYANSGCEESFRQLVDQHINLVYSAALRQVRDTALADDVTQTVFISLARRAGYLNRRVPLDAWLLKVTHNAVYDAQRRRARRRYHERGAASMSPTRVVSTSDSDWEAVCGHLDKVLADLGESDRNLIILRFMRSLSLKDVGAAMGMSENTAGKRIARLLEKLRGKLVRKGVNVPAASVAVLMGTHGIGRAPAALAATIAQAAMSSAKLGLGAAIARWLVSGSGRATALLTVLAALFVAGVAVSVKRSGPARNQVQTPVVGAPGDSPQIPGLAAASAAAADYAFAARELPRATYFADAGRNVFPAGLLDKLDGSNRPVGWDDVADFNAGSATVFNDQRRWLRLSNDQPSVVVAVRTALPLQSGWRTLAVGASLRSKNLKIDPATNASAGVGFAFLDAAGKRMGGGTLVTPYVGKSFPTYTRVMMATLSAPVGANSLLISVQMAGAVGTLDVADIVVSPVDKSIEPDPAAVVSVHDAVRDGNLSRVKQMIQRDHRLLECRNMDFSGGTPLVGTAARDRADIAGALIALGANVKATDLAAVANNAGWTPVEWAAYWGSTKTLRVLLAATDESPRELVQYAQAGQADHARKDADSRYFTEDYAGSLELLAKAASTRPTTMPGHDEGGTIQKVFQFLGGG